jgi:hypothetical protein
MELFGVKPKHKGVILKDSEDKQAFILWRREWSLSTSADGSNEADDDWNNLGDDGPNHTIYLSRTFRILRLTVEGGIY